MPNGMPIMVTQKTKPITKYPSAEKKPPKINQIKLPIAFIYIVLICGAKYRDKMPETFVSVS